MEVNPKRYFKTVFLEEVDAFFEIIGGKAFRKISYNIEHAEQTNNPELFKKLTNNIWEFEPNMETFTTGCWHFGIKQIRLIRW